jgi:hypothetical protein
MSATAFSLRRALFLRSSIFLLLALQIQAYTASRSCYSYGTDQRDISNGIQAAMAEAAVLASLSGTLIVQGSPVGDDTRSRLFRGAAPQDFIDVQGSISRSVEPSKLTHSSALPPVATESRLLFQTPG